MRLSVRYALNSNQRTPSGCRRAADEEQSIRSEPPVSRLLGAPRAYDVKLKNSSRNSRMNLLEGLRRTTRPTISCLGATHYKHMAALGWTAPATKSRSISNGDINVAPSTEKW